MKTISDYSFKKVLLIDDGEIDNIVNQKIIEANFFAEEVQVKTNIPSALSYIYNILDKKDPLPDVIFLDLNLPEYNGFHFLLELKQMMYKYEELKGISIVILSAFLDKYSEMAFKNFNFVVDRLSKPLSEASLSNVKTKINEGREIIDSV
jgi:CheY-like chemotaxis protein